MTSEFYFDSSLNRPVQGVFKIFWFQIEINEYNFDFYFHSFTEFCWFSLIFIRHNPSFICKIYSDLIHKAIDRLWSLDDLILFTHALHVWDSTLIYFKIPSFFLLVYCRGGGVVGWNVRPGSGRLGVRIVTDLSR